jgi:hypothetical protein
VVDKSHSGGRSISASALTTVGGLLTAVGATVATAVKFEGGKLPRGKRSM